MNADVPDMMVRVDAAIRRVTRGQRTGPVVISPATEDRVGIAALRVPGQLVTEFPSGSNRPVVGKIIRTTKRLVRRALRWYIDPIAAQQTRFNQLVLSLTERLAAATDRVSDEVLLVHDEHIDVVAGLKRDLERLQSDVDALTSTIRGLQSRPDPQIVADRRDRLEELGG